LPGRTILVGLGVISEEPILSSSCGFKDPAQKLLSLANLEADLDALVDSIEAEWRLHGTVRRESAEQVHALLERALAL